MIRPLLLRTACLVAAAVAMGCGRPAAEPGRPQAGAAAPARPAPAALREITFDDIKLDIQKDEPFEPDRLTDRVRELERQRVRIRGYIL
ncbi:MAG: hypothetical protein ACKO40_00795, partial [Planctomycetaceae bacterium]